MLVLVSVVGIVLIGAWILALRAHLRRRASRAAEWEGAGQRPALWTSSARCLSCGAGGGVVEEHDGGLWFVCLRCGRRQVRHTHG